MRKTTAPAAPQLAEWKALEGAAVAGGVVILGSLLETKYDTELEVLPAAAFPPDHRWDGESSNGNEKRTSTTKGHPLSSYTSFSFPPTSVLYQETSAIGL
jgi:hypothetical protein